MSPVEQTLKILENPGKAVSLSRFFKTGTNQYGYGDIFLGITVPEQQKIAKQYYKSTSLSEIQSLLRSNIHEFRLTALLILGLQFKVAGDADKSKVVDFYLENIKYVNNWDLVDSSSRDILGEYLALKDKQVLDRLSVSGDLWQERISIVATYSFIKRNDFEYTLKLSEKFLSHKHDLIHKATGWMLREVGKRDLAVLEKFIRKNYHQIPRTTLRYAIERYPPELRSKILKNTW